MITNKKHNSLLIHPIRLRIVGALVGREITVEQLAQILDDVPSATLYRHTNALLRGGVLQVVGERRQQGRTHRLLTLAEGAGLLDRKKLNPRSVKENTQAVNTFLAQMMAVFASALRDPHNAPNDWALAGFQAYLTVEEENALVAQVRDLLLAAGENPPAPGRRRRVIPFGVLPERELPVETQISKKR